jgi:hypothetical protein
MKVTYSILDDPDIVYEDDPRGDHDEDDPDWN